MPENDTETRLDALSRRLDDADRRWDEVVPLLDRIAAALERIAATGLAAPASAPPSGVDPSRRFLDAIRAEDWDEAELVRTGPGVDPATAQSWAERIARAQAEVRTTLQAQIDAARAANDPLAVLDLRDRLQRLLEPDAARESDQSLIRWIMALIQKRLRGGTIGPDVAQLAQAVAERFAATPEGASLRAALPTLRRSSGLCPRCGAPYVGEEDTCPECRKGTPPAATSPTAEAAPEPAAPTPAPTPTAWGDDPDDEEREPVDLNSDGIWETD